MDSSDRWTVHSVQSLCFPSFRVQPGRIIYSVFLKSPSPHTVKHGSYYIHNIHRIYEKVYSNMLVKIWEGCMIDRLKVLPKSNLNRDSWSMKNANTRICIKWFQTPWTDKYFRHDCIDKHEFWITNLRLSKMDSLNAETLLRTYFSLTFISIYFGWELKCQNSFLKKKLENI